MRIYLMIIKDLQNKEEMNYMHPILFRALFNDYKIYQRIKKKSFIYIKKKISIETKCK